MSTHLLHFSGSFLCILRNFGTAQKPCKFVDRFLRSEAFDPCHSRSVGHFLGNSVVRIRHRGDLRKVCDTQYLTVHRDHSHLLSDLLCGPSGNTRIHLIEDQRPGAVLRREHRLDPQHDAGELTAGDDLIKLPAAFSGIGRDHKGNGILSAGRIALRLPEGDREIGAREIKVFKLGCNIEGKALRIFLSGLRELLRGSLKLLFPETEQRLELLSVLLVVLQLRKKILLLLQSFQNIINGPPVL